jgi:hypothetical protein
MTIFTIANITAFIDTAANAISIGTAVIATFRATTAFARRIRNRAANRRTRRANAARNRTNRNRRNRHKSRGTAPPRSDHVARTSTRYGRHPCGIRGSTTGNPSRGGIIHDVAGRSLRKGSLRRMGRGMSDPMFVKSGIAMKG